LAELDLCAKDSMGGLGNRHAFLGSFGAPCPGQVWPLAGHARDCYDQRGRHALRVSAILDGAREVFQQAGVPDGQVQDFMETIVKEYPYPSDEDLFVEQISSPLVAMALGERRKDLSQTPPAERVA
jgi:hypothetical protein